MFDDDAIRFADFVRDFNDQFGLSKTDGAKFYKKVVQALQKKGPGQIDSEEVLKIKGLIRRGEAKAGGRYVGIPDEQMHFLDMPFYETGAVKKKPLSEADIQVIMDILGESKTSSSLCCGRPFGSTRNTSRLPGCYLRSPSQIKEKAMGEGLLGLVISRRVAGVGYRSDRNGSATQSGRANEKTKSRI